jgi:hypothetical protein
MNRGLAAQPIFTTDADRITLLGANRGQVELAPV